MLFCLQLLQLCLLLLLLCLLQFQHGRLHLILLGLRLPLRQGRQLQPLLLCLLLLWRRTLWRRRPLRRRRQLQVLLCGLGWCPSPRAFLWHHVGFIGDAALDLVLLLCLLLAHQGRHGDCLHHPWVGNTFQCLCLQSGQHLICMNHVHIHCRHCMHNTLRR